MKFYSNTTQIIKRLEEIKTAVGGSAGGNGAPPAADFSDAIFGALNAGMGLMKRRIFTNGEDAQGQPLGDYHGGETRLTGKRLSIIQEDSDREKERKKLKRVVNRIVKNSPDEKYTEYEKERIIHGRQIDKKDLEFTGSLRKSIEAVKKDPSTVVIAIINEDDAKIARYQEQQIGNIRAGQNANKGTAEPAPIFILSQAEFDQVSTEGNRLIKEVIKNKFLK